MDNLFATHPSTENRIAALRQLAAQMGVSRFDRPRTGPNYPGQGSGRGRLQACSEGSSQNGKFTGIGHNEVWLGQQSLGHHADPALAPL